MKVEDVNRYNWKMIAGRGKPGDANWGATLDRDKETVLKEYKELKKHLGETVLITGGGGGGFKIGTLTEVETIECEDKTKLQLRARIKNVQDKGVFGKTKKDEINPWIDSWQISIMTSKKNLGSTRDCPKGHVKAKLDGTIIPKKIKHDGLTDDFLELTDNDEDCLVYTANKTENRNVLAVATGKHKKTGKEVNVIAKQLQLKMVMGRQYISCGMLYFRNLLDAIYSRNELSEKQLLKMIGVEQ